MKLFFSIIFFLIGSTFCSAQNKEKIIVIGHVTDEHHVALKDADVVDLNTKTGTTTNKNGIFYLSLPRQAINLQIEYTGYKNVQINISSYSLQLIPTDTFFLNISLEIKIEELNNITVTAIKTQLAYNKPRILILDYDFYENYVLLLTSENQKNKLRLIDDESNTISELTLKTNPDKLYKDCLGNIHVIGTDSTHQVRFDKIKLSLLEGHSIQKFNDFVLPMVAEAANNTFFKIYGLYNQSIIYFNYDKNNDDKKVLKEIRNIEAENFVKGDRRQSYRHQFRRGYNNPIVANGKQEAFYQIILTMPIYDPLLEMKDSLFLFDHLDDTAFVYNKDGILCRNFSIKYHHEKGWKNELIVDYSKKQVYAKYTKYGVTSLLQIDPINGRILNKFEIENTFPKSIKIKNGYIYYLYKDRFEDLAITNLYKQRIK